MHAVPSPASSSSSASPTTVTDDTTTTSNPVVTVHQVHQVHQVRPVPVVPAVSMAMPVGPVVSSQFGKRPLLEVPALNVDNDPARLEISSMEDRPKPFNIVHRLDATNLLHKKDKAPPAPQPEPHQQAQAFASPQHRGIPTLAPGGAMTMTLPITMNDFPGSLFGPPPGSRQQPRGQFGGQQGGQFGGQQGGQFGGQFGGQQGGQFGGQPGGQFGGQYGGQQGGMAPPGGNMAQVFHSQFINVPDMPMQAPNMNVVDASGNPVPGPTSFPQPGNMPMQGPNMNVVDASGNPVPAPTAFPQPGNMPPPQMMPPQNNYPAPNPGYYPQPQYPQPGPFPQQQYPQQGAYPQPQYPQPQPQYGGPMPGGYPRPPGPGGPPNFGPQGNFNVEGVLEFGRLTTIHFRDGNLANFRGLPEFLRMELQNTYGQYPRTNIRVVSQNGQFHVYATPHNAGGGHGGGGHGGGEHGGGGGDGVSIAGSESDYGDFNAASNYSVGTPGQRKLGFNQVVGHPRSL